VSHCKKAIDLVVMVRNTVSNVYNVILIIITMVLLIIVGYCIWCACMCTLCKSFIANCTLERRGFGIPTYIRVDTLYFRFYGMCDKTGLSAYFKAWRNNGFKY